MSAFGWCLTPGHHKECVVKVQKFIHIPAKRNTPASIQMIDEYYECSCYCHKPGGKPPRRRKTK